MPRGSCAPLDPDDVLRLGEESGADGNGNGAGDETRIVLPGVRRIIQPKTPGQAAYLRLIAENDIVVGIGPAGTGKTYLAVAVAVEALARKRVRRIVLARPAVEAGESLGFLPGDMQAKVDPYLRPLYDALDDMMPPERMHESARDAGDRDRAARLHARPHARRCVRDSRRSAERDQRANEDVPHAARRELEGRDHGRQDADRPAVARGIGARSQIERILKGIDGIAFHYLTDADVIRHRLVRDIIRAYARDGGTE